MGKGYLVLLFRFYSQKSTSKIRFSSVSPVTIPALTTIMDRQFKKTGPCVQYGPEVLPGLNQGPKGFSIPNLYFLQKGHTSRHQTHYSLFLVKTTILQSFDLIQVKAHDIRAFSASKAFYGGVSVDQIMQACHWKSHNTFTNFYLKDLTLSDNVMYRYYVFKLGNP